MRVLYDYQAFLQRRGGVSRYFAELIGALSRIDGFEATFPVIFSDNEYLEKRRVLLIRKHFKGKIMIMAALNRFSAVRALRSEYEIFHPTYYRPYFLKSIRRPFVVTVHDMIHELFPERVRDDGTATNKRLLCARASLIIAVSTNTKNDLCRLLDIDPGKVSVIHHATSLSFDGSPRMVDKPYLLYVGERSGYKNFQTFLRAVALLLPRHDLELVCAGGGSLSRAESDALRQYEILGRVRHFEALSSSQLANLYHFASVFVYPSLYEGFGLPLLEAFACGCPVAASGNSSIPEVAGEAAEVFDPRSADSLSAAVEKILCSPSRSRQLVEAGAARLGLFSWEKTAMQTLQIYRKARDG